MSDRSQFKLYPLPVRYKRNKSSSGKNAWEVKMLGASKHIWIQSALRHHYCGVSVVKLGLLCMYTGSSNKDKYI